MLNKAETNLKLDWNDLVIRPVKRADLPDLEWGGAYLKYRRMYASIYRDSQRRRILMWIIEHKIQGLVGQVFVLLNSNEPDAADGRTYAYVFAFRIKPVWRNLGIGSHLMHFVEDDLRDRGFRCVTLNVAKENMNALRLYQRLGYQITGSKPGVWSYEDHTGKTIHIHEPAWRMEKHLNKTT